MANTRVDVPATAKRGEIIEIRTLVSHVMETGFRRTYLGVPLPRIFWPRVEAFESGEGGVYRFHVEIGLPLIGRLVRYRGSLDRCLTSR